MRDLRFVIDSSSHSRAGSMKRLMKETARKVRESPDRRLAEPDSRAVRKRCRTILTRGKRERPKPPSRTKGETGRREPA